MSIVKKVSHVNGKVTIVTSTPEHKGRRIDECKEDPSPEFVKALQSLAPHVLTNLPLGAHDTASMEELNIKSLTLQVSDGCYASCIIGASLKIEELGAWNFTTPKIQLEKGDEVNQELADAIDTIVGRAKEYREGGARAQTELSLDENETVEEFDPPDFEVIEEESQEKPETQEEKNARILSMEDEAAKAEAEGDEEAERAAKGEMEREASVQ